MRGIDSAAVNMRDPKIKFSILPYKDNYKVPVLNVSTHTSRLMARDLTNRISIGNGEISLQAILDDTSNRERKARMGKMLDSLQKIYPDKEIILFYSREILLGGGNIHCITQQQPK